jgi:hypothetical protein
MAHDPLFPPGTRPALQPGRAFLDVGFLASGAMVGTMIGGLAFAVAVWFCPVEFAWWGAFGKGFWLSLEETYRHNWTVGSGQGFVSGLVITVGVWIVTQRGRLLREFRSQATDLDTVEVVEPIPTPAEDSPADTGIMSPQDGYRPAPVRDAD